MLDMCLNNAGYGGWGGGGWGGGGWGGGGYGGWGRGGYGGGKCFFVLTFRFSEAIIRVSLIHLY